MFREVIHPQDVMLQGQLKSNIPTLSFATKKEVELHLWMNIVDMFCRFTYYMYMYINMYLNIYIYI